MLPVMDCGAQAAIPFSKKLNEKDSCWPRTIFLCCSRFLPWRVNTLSTGGCLGAEGGPLGLSRAQLPSLVVAEKDLSHEMSQLALGMASVQSLQSSTTASRPGWPNCWRKRLLWLAGSMLLHTAEVPLPAKPHLPRLWSSAIILGNFQASPAGWEWKLRSHPEPQGYAL